MKQQIIKASLDNIGNVVKVLVETLRKDTVIFLRGDLAAGKTTLVKELAKAKGLSSERVTSPTFSIEHVYSDDFRHYDLYQCSCEKFLSMGLLESLESSGWHFIEWGEDRLKEMLKSYGFFTVLVEIKKCNGEREYRIEVNA